VLDLTRVIAGPVAGRVLALYGADVLAVTAPSLPQIDALVVETGFGKRSTFLDLRDNEDAATFHRLVTTSDVLIESYRPGALERLGFGERACAVLNPNLVYVSISAYGDGGTWGQRRGFDSLVQMVTGIACGANAFEPPTPLPSQALDHGTGWLAAAAALAAVERTRRLGGAWYVTLSLARTADFLLSTGPRNASQNDSKPWAITKPLCQVWQVHSDH
jgi:crotonobetainyl-CoA:carnitine CoA-transferase CaiB-like acyl-CoA transferase